MSSPIKELPKISSQLSSELLTEHHLRETKTQEKIILPTKEIIDKEKSEKCLLEEIEKFSPQDLTHAKTVEKQKLPTKEELESERKNN